MIKDDFDVLRNLVERFFPNVEINGLSFEDLGVSGLFFRELVFFEPTFGLGFICIDEMLDDDTKIDKLIHALLHLAVGGTIQFVFVGRSVVFLDERDDALYISEGDYDAKYHQCEQEIVEPLMSLTRPKDQREAERNAELASLIFGADEYEEFVVNCGTAAIIDAIMAAYKVTRAVAKAVVISQQSGNHMIKRKLRRLTRFFLEWQVMRQARQDK